MNKILNYPYPNFSNHNNGHQRQNYQNLAFRTTEKSSFFTYFKGAPVKVSSKELEFFDRISSNFKDLFNFHWQDKRKVKAFSDFIEKLKNETIPSDSKITFLENFGKRAIKTGATPMYSKETIQQICTNKSDESKLFTPYLKKLYNNPDFKLILNEDDKFLYKLLDTDGNTVATLGIFGSYLANLWVNPLVRGSKTSKKALETLFKKAEDVVKYNGYDRMILEVYPDNKKAILGYLNKQGFLVSEFSEYKRIPKMEKTLKEGILSAEEIEYRQGLTKNLLEYMESLIQEKNINLIV